MYVYYSLRDISIQRIPFFEHQPCKRNKIVNHNFINFTISVEKNTVTHLICIQRPNVKRVPYILPQSSIQSQNEHTFSFFRSGKQLETINYHAKSSFMIFISQNTSAGHHLIISSPSLLFLTDYTETLCFNAANILHPRFYRNLISRPFILSMIFFNDLKNILFCQYYRKGNDANRFSRIIKKVTDKLKKVQENIYCQLITVF